MKRNISIFSHIVSIVIICCVAWFAPRAAIGNIALASPASQQVQTYANEQYGFSFQYSPHWTLQEEPNLIRLYQQDITLSITFHNISDNFRAFAKTPQFGTFQPRGSIPFLGVAIPKHVLVYEGKDKTVQYNHTPDIPINTIIFNISLRSSNPDDQSFALPLAIQDEADAIVRSFAFFTPVPTPSPEPRQPATIPVPFPPNANFAALQTELEHMITSWSGQHAVSVTDLQTGQTISVNGSRPQIAACTIKIGIMIAVAQDIQDGIYLFKDVAGFVQSAMGPSNTPPARELLRIVGKNSVGNGIHRVNQIMWGLGATNSIITHPPGYPSEEYGYAQSRGIVENLLTTDDLVLILSKLYRGEILSPSATNEVLQSMTIAPDWMNRSFNSALPAGVQLYHKVGQIYTPGVWNDAGIVVFEHNGQHDAYALAYLGTVSGQWQEPYTHAQALSAKIWDFFNRIYRQ